MSTVSEPADTTRRRPGSRICARCSSTALAHRRSVAACSPRGGRGRGVVASGSRSGAGRSVLWSTGSAYRSSWSTP